MIVMKLLADWRWNIDGDGDVDGNGAIVCWRKIGFEGVTNKRLWWIWRGVALECENVNEAVVTCFGSSRLRARAAKMDMRVTVCGTDKRITSWQKIAKYFVGLRIESGRKQGMTGKCRQTSFLHKHMTQYKVYKVHGVVTQQICVLG